MVRSAHPDPYKAILGDQSCWWVPEQLEPTANDASSSSSSTVLSVEQLERFSSDGFLVVDGLWPSPLVERAGNELSQLLPSSDAGAAARGSSGGSGGIPGSDGLVTLPTAATVEGSRSAEMMAVNQLPICVRVLAAVAQLLQAHVSEVRLSQCHASVKHGRVSTMDNMVRDEDALGDFAAAGSGAEEQEQQHLAGDQDHHLDFWDNMLLVPGRSPPPAVAALCYYSDVEKCAGATHLTRTPLSAAETMLPSGGAGTPPPGRQVRRSAARETQPAVVEETGAGRIQYECGWFRDAAEMAQVYAQERPVRFRRGTCVLYLLDTWHRGTPVALGESRHTVHFVWRRVDAPFVGFQALPPALAYMPPQYMAGLTPTQRAVLGIPPPGHPYWNDATVQLAFLRYKWDVAPYVARL
jgi:hypothetical protein